MTFYASAATILGILMLVMVVHVIHACGTECHSCHGYAKCRPWSESLLACTPPPQCGFCQKDILIEYHGKIVEQHLYQCHTHHHDSRELLEIGIGPRQLESHHNAAHSIDWKRLGSRVAHGVLFLMLMPSTRMNSG